MKEKEITEAKAVLEKHGLIAGSVSLDYKKSKSSSVVLFGDAKQQEKKRNQKKNDMDELKSVTSSKSKNYNKRIVCDLCNKEMRSDALKSHRGSKFCKKI
jgi:hypothetical protein